MSYITQDNGLMVAPVVVRPYTPMTTLAGGYAANTTYFEPIAVGSNGYEMWHKGKKKPKRKVLNRKRKGHTTRVRTGRRSKQPHNLLDDSQDIFFPVYEAPDVTMDAILGEEYIPAMRDPSQMYVATTEYESITTRDALEERLAGTSVIYSAAQPNPAVALQPYAEVPYSLLVASPAILGKRKDKKDHSNGCQRGPKENGKNHYSRRERSAIRESDIADKAERKRKRL